MFGEGSDPRGGMRVLPVFAIILPNLKVRQSCSIIHAPISDGNPIWIGSRGIERGDPTDFTKSMLCSVGAECVSGDELVRIA